MPCRDNALAHRCRAAKWSIRRIASLDQDDEQWVDPKHSFTFFLMVNFFVRARITQALSVFDDNTQTCSSLGSYGPLHRSQHLAWS
jgi:hypothetical protein